MPTLTELADAFEGQKTALKAYMDEHKTPEGTYDLDAEGVKKVREMNADLDKAHDAWRTQADLAGIGEKTAPGVKAGTPSVAGDTGTEADPKPQGFNLKAVLDESEGLQVVRERGSSFRGTRTLFEIDDPDVAEHWLKATIALTDITPQETQRPAIVPSAQFRITVADLMASGTTDGNTLTYIEETTFTNNAVETAETVTKGEAVIDFTERTDSVRKIATWVPATDEVLSDNRQLRSYIEGRLRFMVEQREEQQLLVGDGTAPNISGVTDRSGIQTQAKGADPTPDAFFKALTKVRVTGDAEPSGIVVHPNDWEPIRLLRTADGIYIFGAPTEVGPERMWGLPVRVTTGITENTGLVGDFRTMAQVFRREGLRVEASTEHASFFIENKVAILAETRLALAVYRPAAFCTVTGI